MVKEARSTKMYKNPPKMERDDKGNMGVKMPDEADSEQAGTEGVPLAVHQAHERHQMHHRHETEHMALHHRHESEHMAHDAAKGGSKHAMHEKHEGEHKEMTTRHHGEMKKLHAKHEKGGKEEYEEPKPAEHGKEMPKKEKKAKAEEGGEKA